MGDKKKKKNNNKLILFLSPYKPYGRECIYKSKYDGTKYEIKGIQTPDAPTKYFINYLDEMGEEIDTILCITSKKANNKVDDKIYDSAFEDYEKMLNNFCYERGVKVPELMKLNFDYDFENNVPIKDSDIYRDLFENIVKKLSRNKSSKDDKIEDVIYIDYTSGIRDTSLLIILMIRYLEYTGIKCGGMIYSYYDNDDQTKNKIIDIKSTYDLFELLDGVNEFTSFGKSKSLSNYYNNIWNEKGENYKEISELIDVMDKFSETMSLCIVEDIDQIIYELNEKISAVKELNNKKDLSDNQNKLMVYMFLNLIKEIEKKFYLDEGEEITYINLIKWCLDNDLIQQALTLYVEKMPEYYEECGFFNKDDESLLYTINDSKINYEDSSQVFYSGLFTNVKNIKKEEDNYPKDDSKPVKNEIQEFKSIIKENKFNILQRRKNYLKEYDKKIKKAIEEIYNIMDKMYTKDLRNVKVYNKKRIAEFNEIIPTSEEKFVNWLDQQNKLLAYLLNISYKNKPEKTFNNNKDITYDKKINSINILKESKINPTWSELPLDDLLILMQDYLFFKIMRNQINHAKKSNLTSTVKEYFKEVGYDIDITVNNIKTTMRKSIENIEKMEKNKKSFEVI